MRTFNKLSPRVVASLKAPGRYGDGGNLYLNVADSGSKAWVFIYRDRSTGRQRELGLGSARDTTLAEARKLAAERRRQLGDGEPIEGKRSTGMVPVKSFGALAEAFIADHSPGWRSAEHARQWATSLRDHAASLRDVPIAEIDTEAVLAVLRPIWQTRRVTADRVRGRIERILDAAKARGLRTGENPARWRGHLDQLLPRAQRLQKSHHAAMPYEALPAFLARLRKQPGISPLALEFAILTAARTDEVLSATWAEFDLDAPGGRQMHLPTKAVCIGCETTKRTEEKERDRLGAKARDALWTIPATRMKGGREHTVPLSDRAVEILRLLSNYKTVGSSDAFVFPGQRPGTALSSCMMLQCAKELDQRITVHGFRSTFRDWAGDCTPTPRDVVEAALAHAVGNPTEAAYRRSSALAKRRELMAQWSAYCCQEPADNVVQLRA